MAGIEPRLSFFATNGSTGRRTRKVSAARVAELDRLPDAELAARFAEPCTEVLTDDRGRLYEARIWVDRDASGLNLTVQVADLPRRRTLVGDGLVRCDGVTPARRALLYSQE